MPSRRSEVSRTWHPPSDAAAIAWRHRSRAERGGFPAEQGFAEQVRDREAGRARKAGREIVEQPSRCAWRQRREDDLVERFSAQCVDDRAKRVRIPDRADGTGAFGAEACECHFET